MPTHKTLVFQSTGDDLPFPNLRSIAPNVRYFLHNNAKGVFMQANGNGLTSEFSDLRNYLISHLIWDPYLDSDALLNEEELRDQ